MRLLNEPDFLAMQRVLPLDVDVNLVAENGSTLGSKRYTLPPLGMTQVTKVVRDLGVSANVKGARLVLSTPTDGAAFCGLRIGDRQCD